MMILFSKDLLENLMFNIIFQACRPRQWTKNFIVFAGPAFNFDYSGDILQNSIISVISFCLISSSIYLLNDVLDIKSDRKHTTSLGDSFKMTPEEKTISFLNNYFVFKKIRNIDTLQMFNMHTKTKPTIDDVIIYKPKKLNRKFSQHTLIF